MVFRRITIIRARTPATPSMDVNEQLQILGGTLGLFNLRDKDKSCFRIFITLLRDVNARHGFTSDELALRTALTRGTVVHHLNKLMASGIVQSERSRYFLSFENLDELIDLVQNNVNRTLEGLRETAQELDRKLGLGEIKEPH